MCPGCSFPSYPPHGPSYRPPGVSERMIYTSIGVGAGDPVGGEYNDNNNGLGYLDEIWTPIDPEKATVHGVKGNVRP